MPLILLALATGPASATPPPGKVTIANQATLLADGSAVITVTYTCQPGPGNDTTGAITSALQQGPTIGNADALATCDGRSQTVSLDEMPGPFSRGTANALVIVENTAATSFASTSRGVMIR
jgi:hypothetical protein